MLMRSLGQVDLVIIGKHTRLKNMTLGAYNRNHQRKSRRRLRAPWSYSWSWGKDEQREKKKSCSVVTVRGGHWPN